MYKRQVFCFTPSGDVKNLPSGSTPIDFAYSIHSAVGNKMVGAKANGVLVNIDYVIKNGDRIEILTSQNSKGPSRDWLKIVKSTQAKNKINQWFKAELKEDNIIRGRDMIDKYCRNKGINYSELNKPEFMEKVMKLSLIHILILKAAWNRLVHLVNYAQSSVAVRIIVDTVKDCYGALGVIHEMYKPIPGRFKD